MGWIFLHSLSAEPQKAGSLDRALDLFAQLGLPDTRTAKWVTADFGDGRRGTILPESPGKEYIGNAWLVRQYPDRKVELIVNQSHRVVARRAPAEAEAEVKPGDTLPAVQIAEADLAEDLKTFSDAIRQTSKSKKDASKGEDESKDDDEGSSDLSDHGSGDRTNAIGQSILFLAHIQTQGQAKVVQELLPKLLSQAPSPEAALNSAVSALADGLFAQATDEWVERGDAAAYSKRIAALCAEFPRGWQYRDAVLMLLKRLEAQNAPRSPQDAIVKEAAALLMEIRGQDLGRLPLGENWLIPGGSDRRRSGRYAASEMEEDEDVEESDDLEAATVPDASAPADGKDDSIKKFFSRRREAATALANLVGDGRLLRLLKNRDEQQGNYHFTRGESREAVIEQVYAALRRPYQLGELAFDLLRPILPDHLQYGMLNESGRGSNILSWLKEISFLSDEQLAWDALRKANGPYDSDFRNALGFLVKHGNAETITNLKEVFLDPPVWQGGVDRLAPLLGSYIKRLPDGGGDFGAQVIAVAKKGLEAQHSEYSEQMQRSMSAEMKKMYEAQFAAQLKALEQVVKPRSVADLLAEVESADETEALALIQRLGRALAGAPFGEAETGIFKAAANATGAQVKQQLLYLMMQLYSRAARNGSQKGAVPAVTQDPAARAAIRTLLDDASTAPEMHWASVSEVTIADLTAQAVAGYRISPAERSTWSNLGRTAPHVAQEWTKARARAFANGEAGPPMPDGKRVPKERLDGLMAELSLLPPAEVLSAIRSKISDEQLALLEHLFHLPEWPPGLIAAHFTIARVTGNEAAVFPVDAWKNRKFDASARKEISETVERLARDGRALQVMVIGNGMLAGLTLSVSTSQQSFSVEQMQELGLPGLDTNAPPVAAIFCHLVRVGQEDASQPVGYGLPIWKNAARTRAWEQEHLKDSGEANRSTGDDADFALQTNRVPLEKRLRDLFQVKTNSRNPFRLSWMTALIQPEAKPEK